MEISNHCTRKCTVHYLTGNGASRSKMRGVFFYQILERGREFGREAGVEVWCRII
jgi:hypothetical protein